ncbi:MAG: ice-binding family protein [bacterium]
MTNYLKKHLVASFLIIAAFCFAALTPSASAQSVPPLGNAQSFAALAGTTITATGPAVFSGNVGVSPGTAATGMPPGGPATIINGALYLGAGSLAGPAQASALTAYNNLKGQACPAANNLTGKILGQTQLSVSPGVYCFDTSAQLNAIFTLNDGGDPNAIFIFQIGTTLTTASSAQVLMSSGGRGTNVYWQVGTSATIGTSSIFRGHIIANTSITFTTSASTTGRIFALNGAATIDSTNVDAIPVGGYEFIAANFPMNEGCGETTITVKRSDTTGAGTVDYATSDGTAVQRGDYTLGAGTVKFAAGEVSKTFILLGTKDAYNTEGTETFNLALINPIGGTVGAQGTATVSIGDDTAVPASPNPINDAGTFVCQHYHDFLNRQSDPSGQAFWTNEIAICGTNAACIDDRRTNVSAAFFISIEFQNTGYLVIRAHKAAFGSAKSIPRYTTFLRDQREITAGVIIGQPGADTLLEQNKTKFFVAFVQRPEFVTPFPVGTLVTTYVDTLFANAGVTPTTAERNAAIGAYGIGDTAGRAAGLRSVAESNSVFQAHYNPAFVLMQYFGYLRRNPDSAPDTNFAGYDFWLTKMNQFSLPGEDMRDANQALARVKRAEMVKSFIVSGEYLGRFGGSPTGNQEPPPVESDGSAPSARSRGLFGDFLPQTPTRVFGRAALGG